jgi:hypothetical protein
MTDREPSRFSDTRKSDNLRRAVEKAITMLKVGLPEYWADDVQQVLEEALRAERAEPEKERAEVAPPARSGVDKCEIDPLTGEAYREHITDGSPCWCNPELNYRDPDTGTELWIHRREQ